VPVHFALKPWQMAELVAAWALEVLKSRCSFYMPDE
jgi:hypothetical protein